MSREAMMLEFASEFIKPIKRARRRRHTNVIKSEITFNTERESMSTICFEVQLGVDIDTT
eukprot:SAG22_NODE_335_length_12071_cov_5.268771_7_plen_60_part_00